MCLSIGVISIGGKGKVGWEKGRVGRGKEIG